MAKKVALVFDFDGTFTKSNIYDPILIHLKKEKKFFAILVLFILYPLIFIIDKINRPFHQLLIYSFFKEILINYKYEEALFGFYSSRKIELIEKITKHIKNKEQIYFISTNHKLIKEYLKNTGFNNVFCIDLKKLNYTYLKNFKEQAIKKILIKTSDSITIGFGDSRYDLDFLEKCKYSYLIKNNKLVLLNNG
jgi:hydroxymethylpyrimidine pyrophosphatase-like HAD family hydrolase